MSFANNAMKLMLNFYEAIFRVQSKVADSTIQMQKDFAPIPKDNTKIARLILDAIGLGFVLFSAPAFNMGTFMRPEEQDNVLHLHCILISRF